MAGKGKKHLVDGEWMTVSEAAARLAIKPQQIYHQMSARKCGLQAVVRMYRDGMIIGQGRAARYMVGGKWMTIRDAAEMLGVTVNAIRMWMYRHRHMDGSQSTLSEAIAAYRDGRVTRQRGRVAVQYYVGRKPMTIQDAADMLGVSRNCIQLYMHRHRCSLARAVKFYDAKKRKRAEHEIMKILGY
jgi:transposase